MTPHTHTHNHAHATHTHTLADYKSRGGQLPVRWTAIEALEDRKFNEKTDVWSCGVLLYEIWTDAVIPYEGWTNQKVWVEVAAGYRLPKPPGCSSDIYEMLRKCWLVKQEERPTFKELAVFFRTKAGADVEDSNDARKPDEYLDVRHLGSKRSLS